MTDNVYLDLLRRYWGYDSFRGIQEEIIHSVGEGKDTLGLMPTGGGKSVTFQLPTLAQEGLCLVVTPLIALMKDQVQNLRERGIMALSIHSGMSRQEIVTTLENCIFGPYKFLYVSPERLDTELFRIKLQRMHVCLIAVDESHCISQWGYDFRPAYLRIAEIRALLPDVPILALTATATPEVVKDIQKQLLFRKENVFRMSFERKNLAYIVRRTENKAEELLHILRNMAGSAIVYVRNRQRTKEIADQLMNEHITAEFYHAGLGDAERDTRQQRWQRGESRVMVATNAFGMGIDKPDVRIVVHIDPPDSIESYFQEAGRAGRDGQKAYAVILLGPADATLLRTHISQSYPEKAFIRQVYEHLQYYFQMAMGDGRGCMREFDIEDFCYKFKHFPVQVESALKILTQAGYLEYSDEQDNASRLKFVLQRDELYKQKGLDEKMDKLIRTILRLYTGLFTDYAYINENNLATLAGLTRQQVYEMLMRLSKSRIVSYIPKKQIPHIIYTRERVESNRLQIPRSAYEERKKRYEERLSAMLEYLNTDTVCRSRMLLRYFGEKNEHDCGMCDTCIRKRKQKGDDIRTSPKQLSADILHLLSSQAMTPAALKERLSAEEDLFVDTLHRLIEEGKIVSTDGLLSSRNYPINA